MGYNQNRFQYTAGDSKLQKQFQDSVNGTFKQSWMYDLENQYIGMSEKTQGKAVFGCEKHGSYFSIRLFCRGIGLYFR